MKIEKHFLTEFNRCYSANSIVVDGQPRILLATEGEGPCLAWTGADYEASHTVWEGPGGTISGRGAGAGICGDGMGSGSGVLRSRYTLYPL